MSAFTERDISSGSAEVSSMLDNGTRCDVWIWKSGARCSRRAQIHFQEDEITFTSPRFRGKLIMKISPGQLIACKCINGKQRVYLEFFKVIKESNGNIRPQEGFAIGKSSINIRIRDAQKFDTIKTYVQAIIHRSQTANSSLKPFLVLINPRSGGGKALHLFQKHVEPIFQQLHTSFQVLVTSHQGHAFERIKLCPPADLTQFRALVTVSGDGLINEVINGMVERPDQLILPIGVIPAGGGNATAGSVICESGISTRHNLMLASAFILTRNEAGDTAGDTAGAPIVTTRADPFSSLLRAGRIDGVLFETGLAGGDVTRQLGVELIECGLMAEMDLLSERVRWMGHSRFTYAGLHSIVKARKFAAKVTYLPGNCVVCQTGDNESQQQTSDEGGFTQDFKIPVTNCGELQDDIDQENDEKDRKLLQMRRYNKCHSLTIPTRTKNAHLVGGGSTQTTYFMFTPLHHLSSHLPPLCEPMPMDWSRLENQYRTIIIMNHGHLSYKVEVFRHSRMDDGLLHMILVDHTASRYQLVHLMNLLISQSDISHLSWVKVIPVVAARVEINADYTVPVMLDGEVMPGGSFQTEVIRGKFSILKSS